jgi:predicted lipid-binding transport protein (Tim44 family)
VEYVGLTNTADDAGDRVVVRVECSMDDYVIGKRGARLKRNDSSSEHTRLCEYWTLGKRDGRWIVVSTETKAEGDHQLEEKMITTPEADDLKLRGDSVMEQAAADKPLEGFKTSDLASPDFSEDARARALDLSLADGRFALDVLETAAARAVAAWTEAVDGEDDQLEALATPNAVQELLYTDAAQKRRIVVRGPEIEAITVTALDSNQEPPTMTLEVRAKGRRYVQDRDTAAVISGSADSDISFTERWTLALSGPDSNPWQIVDAEAPAGTR